MGFPHQLMMGTTVHADSVFKEVDGESAVAVVNTWACYGKFVLQFGLTRARMVKPCDVVTLLLRISAHVRTLWNNCKQHKVIHRIMQSSRPGTWPHFAEGSPGSGHVQMVRWVR